MNFKEFFNKNKKTVGLVVIALVVIVIIAVVLNYYYPEKFTGIDSSFLYNVGLFGESPVSPEFDENHSGVKPNEDPECEIPSLADQQKFLTQKVDQLTSDDLLPPTSEDYILSTNYLTSGFQHGVESRTAKNANFQLRKDPVVPRVENITPFNQPVIDSQDMYRKPLDDC